MLAHFYQVLVIYSEFPACRAGRGHAGEEAGKSRMIRGDCSRASGFRHFLLGWLEQALIPSVVSKVKSRILMLLFVM